MENKNEFKVLDEKQWKVEAEAVIADVKEHVKNIELSLKLESTSQRVHLNLTTLEGLEYCVELSSLGFSIVGNKHDNISSDRDYKYFETPYSLLENISPRYTQSFGSMLFDKLNKINDGQ